MRFVKTMLAMVAVFHLIGSGCKKYYRLDYRTEGDLNTRSGDPGQPVLVGLYPLSGLPEGLETDSCAQLSNDLASRTLLKDVLLRELAPVSLVPNERSSVKVPRIRGERWLLIVPFFEDKCNRDADQWALLRIWPTTRRRSLEFSSFNVSLPWERRPWRQRGCVDGVASHVSWPVCD